jgi:molecular chaperone GrpE
MSEREAEGREQHPGRSESAEEASAEGPGAAPIPIDAIARLQAEKDELMQTLVRRQADFENYRKRVERERQEESRRAASRLIESLLPVVDGFERALRSHEDPAYEEYHKGLELIYRQLLDVLARQGLERIQAAGKPFDPNFHQAIERVETREHADGTVVSVLQDGFVFHGRVLRPSIVRVAVNPEGAGNQGSEPMHREAH